jgi:hypothetical protein
MPRQPINQLLPFPPQLLQQPLQLRPQRLRSPQPPLDHGSEPMAVK